jgi:hypothetical protein
MKTPGGASVECTVIPRSFPQFRNSEADWLACCRDVELKAVRARIVRHPP